MHHFSRFAFSHPQHRTAISYHHATSNHCDPAAPLLDSSELTQASSMTDMVSTDVAVFTSSPYLSGSSLQTLMREHDFELGKLTMVTSSTTLQPAKTMQQTFQKAVSLATFQGHHNSEFLGLLAATLKAGASLTVYEPAHNSEGSSHLKKALLLAGFVDSTDRGLVQTAQGQHVCVSIVICTC